MPGGKSTPNKKDNESNELTLTCCRSDLEHLTGKLKLIACKDILLIFFNISEITELLKMSRISYSVFNKKNIADPATAQFFLFFYDEGHASAASKSLIITQDYGIKYFKETLVNDKNIQIWKK